MVTMLYLMCGHRRISNLAFSIAGIVCGIKQPCVFSPGSQPQEVKTAHHRAAVKFRSVRISVVACLTTSSTPSREKNCST